MNTFSRRFLIVTASALFLLPSFGQKNKTILDLKHSIEDSSIVFPQSYETDTQKLMEKWYLKNYTSTDIESTSATDPGATDDEIRQRLADLPTIIDMPYNSIVKSYIERFTQKGRKQVTALLGLSSYYMPIFEQVLEAKGLPLELKYLPIVESGLDPTATSKSGAAGLWQFMPNTARGYGMELNSLVDERRDPYVSTEKAAELLQELYKAYGDWSLAIAAYNCGPATVNKALKRAGGTSDTHDFWSIYYYLPAETRGYVPMFIATNYVMNYYPEHDIAPVLPTKPLVTDTVHVINRVHFDQIAAVLNIPIDEIRILNPQFDEDIIPATPYRPYNLILPSQQIHAYIVSEDQILDYEAEKYARRLEANPGDSNVDAVAAVVEEPANPADPAYLEAQAAEENYELTHPEEQAATPVRRRTTTSQSNQTAQTTTKPVTTPAPSKSTSSNNKTNKNNATASTPSKNVNTQSTSKSSQSSSSASSSTNKTNKKSETTAKQSAASKSKTQESAATNSKSKTKDKKADEVQTKSKETTAANSKTKGKETTATNSKTKGKETTTTANSKTKGKETTATNSKTKGKETTTAANSKTKANTKEKEAPAKQTAKSSQHTVSNGENLTVIAKRNGVSVEELKKANPKIKGDVIRPGDKITVPSKSSSNKKAETTTNSSTSKSSTAKSSTSKSSTSKTTEKSTTKSTSKSTQTTTTSKKKK